MSELQLWGGHECTLNRTRSGYSDQTVRSGHHDRGVDLELFAGIGCKTLRYPVLWERVAPHSIDELDWTWTDQRLERCRALGMEAIAGLVHHGAGPRYAAIETDAFAQGLGKFARAAAERYPWIDRWTPINEPNTTARFAGAYGHWHPHCASERIYWTLLLNQIDATRLAMHAIRAVNSEAKLVQTDDLGRVFGAGPTQEQARYENDRRWAGWDLLYGSVKPGHPLYDHLCTFGLRDRLKAIADDPCPPDVIGVNHYLTSDRFLDHRHWLYPGRDNSGNGRVRYVDIEAIRALVDPPGLAGAVAEAWQRYGAQIALTEIHNGSTREEQVRWLLEAWQCAQDARRLGIDVCAVTVWSLLGSFDWNSLLTRDDGFYEPGAFDVRSDPPRPTAVAKLALGLAKGEAPHPVATEKGWWRRPTRLLAPHRSATPPGAAGSGRPVLIVGRTGTLGAALARECGARGLTHALVGRETIDLGRRASMLRAIARYRPWAVINAAGYVRVDEAESDRDACMHANGYGAADLARACADASIRFVTFSSDLVFDGARAEPYLETDIPAPLNVYGQSKVWAETEIGALGGDALIIRTAAFFSPDDVHNFAVAVQSSLTEKRSFTAADDWYVSPTFVPDLVHAALDLLIDGESGIWHLANDGAVSWHEFGRMLGSALGLDPALVQPASLRDLELVARRPNYSVLGASRGRIMPCLGSAIARFAQARGL